MYKSRYQAAGQSMMNLIDESFEGINRFEKISTLIMQNAEQASLYVAKEIADTIRAKQQAGKHCVLGLATGSTPIGVYNELVRLHREEGLSFSNVISFNLDEYYPIHPNSLQSFNRFMQEYLFNHVDIKPENIHIPHGMIDMSEVFTFCKQYDQLIDQAGGIDLQILGVGRTGHIGFNEPGSGINSPTRLVTLDHITIMDAASDFYGEEYVPIKAITMGVGSILKSKRILLMAWGENKSGIIRETVEGPVTEHIPSSYLQKHPATTILVDPVSASMLTRVSTPWLVGNCNWSDRLTRKGVIWLCSRLQKPILKLTDHDYLENGMSDLLTEYGSSNKINIKVFNDLQHTISGWPGGKPGADDSTRPERALPFPKRVLVFSPHPDDDVISMGGTLARLVEQGHEVHTAYQTTGSIAVFDDDVLRYLDFMDDAGHIFNLKQDVRPLKEKIAGMFVNKNPGQVDADEVLNLKAAIRRSESVASCRFIGMNPRNVHFLNMPFYETGTVKKKSLSDTDINILVTLLKSIQPHQIYAAGDLSDPHGTHRVCMEAILIALEQLKNETWYHDCRLWLYRGAWQEWDIDLVEMAVPLSPEEVMIKRKSIFKHQSQKDRPLFPGVDSREFWQRAEDRNRNTAIIYDQLGMAKYQAIEVFVRYPLP